MTISTTVPGQSDEPDRIRIRTALDQNLFVEAGAGTGKTTALVSRISSLLASRKARVEDIVAITFTRAAASELRARVREELEKLHADPGQGQAETEVIAQALKDLDGAAIQTIDSFALSLLRERPLEAGLPPVIEPLDEIEAGLLFDDRWQQWLDTALDQDVEVAEAVSRAARLGLDDPLRPLRETAKQFHYNYELLSDGMFNAPTFMRGDNFTGWAGEVARLRTLLPYCTDPADKLYVHVCETVLPALDPLVEMEPASREAELALTELPTIKSKLGKKACWKDLDGRPAHEEARMVLSALQDSVSDELKAMRQEVLSTLLNAVSRMITEYAGERRQQGAPEFHDLLVWATELLRHDQLSRSYFQDRYPFVLIDEFQDTDPVQIELAALLTERTRRGEPDAGALFVVGDPKQSIYRFRRADLRATSAVRDKLQRHDGHVFLTSNYRSHESVICWVNHVFGGWMVGDGLSQSVYVELAAAATGDEPGDIPAAHSSGVRLFGDVLEFDNIEDVRRVEADAIARIALSVGSGEWSVRGRDGEPKLSEFGDLCILLKSRTGLGTLERALTEAGVPFSLEGQAFVFNTQDFKDILNCLTAIDDPTDQVAVVAALRSPAFACSDVDLFEWSQAGGGFDYARDGLPGDGQVAAALVVLRRFHDRRQSVSTPQLVEEFIRDRRLRELVLLQKGSDERLRRLNLVVELARKLHASGRSSLREFINWAEDRRASRARMADSVTSENGGNAVRVMTIHGSKGLEFPIVLMTGLTAPQSGTADGVLFDHRPGATCRVGVRLGSEKQGFESDGYDGMREQEKDAGTAENVRLMYVACTRARDHLVVSTFRKSNDSKTLATRIAELCQEGEDLWQRLEIPPYREPPDTRVHAEPTGTPEERERWESDRNTAIKRMRNPAAITATALKPRGPSPEPAPKTESETRAAEPWRIGRGAGERGRAVHAVLQYANLEAGDNVDELARKYAEFHEIPDQADDVARLARAVINSDAIRRAVASGRYWREAPVAVPVDPRNPSAGAIEGIIDLVYEDADGGLVIIDYKTDAVAGRTLEEMASPYVPQLGAYAAAVERITGRRVNGLILIFARPAVSGQPAEYRVPDIEAAKADAMAVAMDILMEKQAPPARRS
ncbi:MAG: UvrD-helicase domain-containing protein [Dehalococcoidia bacterium]